MIQNSPFQTIVDKRVVPVAPDVVLIRKSSIVLGKASNTFMRLKTSAMLPITECWPGDVVCQLSRVKVETNKCRLKFCLVQTIICSLNNAPLATHELANLDDSVCNYFHRRSENIYTINSNAFDDEFTLLCWPRPQKHQLHFDSSLLWKRY
jgi:hypothetical protein